MSKLQVKNVTHAPANMVCPMTTSLRFKSGEHDGSCNFYSTDPKNVKVIQIDTVAKNEVLVTNDTIMISPATQFTYFLNGSVGHFSGDKFCVCLDRYEATVYNMPEKLEFVQDYSSTVTYGFLSDNVGFVKGDLNRISFTLDIKGIPWKIGSVQATVNEQGENLLDLAKKEAEDLKKIMDSPVTGLKPIGIVPVNPIVVDEPVTVEEPVIDIDDNEDPYADIYKDMIPKADAKKMWKDPKEPIEDIRDIIEYLDAGLDL